VAAIGTTNPRIWKIIRTRTPAPAWMTITRMAADMVRLTAQIAVMTTLECMKAGWLQTSRGADCLAMPRVKGWPAASEAQAMTASVVLDKAAL
jgi:hypothetical protein